MKKQLIIAGTVTALGAAGLLGGVAFATTNNTSAGSLVDAIASKFNLNKNEVQKVFDERYTAMEQERESEVKDELAQLVKDGKLTQEQMDKIAAKRIELEKWREENRAAMQGKTVEERQSLREQHRAELDAWMKDNAVPAEYRYLLMGGRGPSEAGGMGGRGMHGGMMRGQARMTQAS